MRLINLRGPANNGLIVDFSSPHGYPEAPTQWWYDPSIDEFHWATTISSCIVKSPTTLALLWPCVFAWIKDGSFCGMYSKPWDPNAHGSLVFAVISSIRNVYCFTWCIYTHCCLLCEITLRCMLFEQFHMKRGKPLDYELISPFVYPSRIQLSSCL
jgi:hypothetical protein